MQKFGLSDSLLDAAKAVLQGKQPEPVVEETPDEEQPQSLEEKKHLDPVGQEDSDVDNDGDVDSSDKYLKKRRKAISKAIAKEDVEQVDELSRETLGSYASKASDARGHKGLSTKKVDNRYTGVARAADKLDKKNMEEDMSVHLSMNKDGKSYTVKKEKTGGRLKKGESISDTHVDDLKDSGVKVHHEEADVEEAKMPRQLKDPKKETLMAYPYKPGKSRVQVVDKKDVKDKEKKGYIHAEEVEVEEGAMKRMATQKDLNLGGTGLKSFKKVTADRKKMKTQPQNSSVDFGKDHRAISTKEEVEDVEEMGSYKLPTALQEPKKKNGKNGSMPVKEAAGEEEVRSSKQAASLAKHYYMKAKSMQAAGNSEAAAKMMSAAKKFYRKSESGEEKEKGGRQQAASERYEIENLGPGEIYFSEVEIEELESVDEAAPMGQSGQPMNPDFVKGAMASSKKKDTDVKAAIKAKMKERGLAKEEAEEVEEAEEQKPLNVKRDALGGPKLDPSKGVATVSEARKGGGAKVGESERSGHRVTKAAKSEPEHIVMQLRKVVSLGKKHEGVTFADGSKKKVHPNVASAALNRYNKSKSGDKEEMQKHMNHSHDALNHVAGGHALSKSPAAEKKSGFVSKSDPTQLKRHGVASASGHYN